MNKSQKEVRKASGASKEFLLACEAADANRGPGEQAVKPTARQYRKFKRGFGSAYKHRDAGK